jgi:hypothetical protein
VIVFLPGSEGLFKSEFEGVVRTFTVLSRPTKLGRMFPCDRGLALPPCEASKPLALVDTEEVIEEIRWTMLEEY